MFIVRLLYGKNQSGSVLESPDMSSQDSFSTRLFLASNSPRRHELFGLMKMEYNHLPAQVDETPLASEDGIGYVRRIAARKALSAADRVMVIGVIIAADTAVIDHTVDGKDEILGKPAGRLAATKMLLQLRGHSHQVLTALTLLRTEDGTILNDLCSTDVPMREYSDSEIEAYVSTGDPLDKAGAYAIQHAGFHPVENMKGCYANVMGLPLCHLARILSKIGIEPGVDVPYNCQAALGYICPVYQDILSVKN